MAGVSYTFDHAELDTVLARLGPLLDFDAGELMDVVGSTGQEQTRRRISDEKSAPDGTPWKPNRAGTPILTQTGKNLLDSVAYVASPTEAEWGASWEHAHVHQEGAVILPKTAEFLRFRVPGGGLVKVKKVEIPARPFIGLSDDNRTEILDVVTDFLGPLVEGAAR